MKVSELIKELKRCPNDSEVYLVKDWETVNERGELTNLRPLSGVTSQRVVVDMGLDFEDHTEVLLEFEEE